jgi:hypothetical protein
MKMKQAAITLLLCFVASTLVGSGPAVGAQELKPCPAYVRCQIDGASMTQEVCIAGCIYSHTTADGTKHQVTIYCKQ